MTVHADRAALLLLEEYGLSHLTAAVPFSAQAAYGDIYLSRDVEEDLCSGMTHDQSPGIFAKRSNEKQAKEINRLFNAYLSHGKAWWRWLCEHVGGARDDANGKWGLLSLAQRSSAFFQRARAEYEIFEHLPNKVQSIDDIYSQSAFCFYNLSENVVVEQWLESFSQHASDMERELATVTSIGGLWAVDHNKSIGTACNERWCARPRSIPPAAISALTLRPNCTNPTHP